VSQRIITGNYLQTRDDLPLLFDRVGTGTQVYSNGHVTMSVGVGQYALCQAKAFAPYLAGKPTSVKLTFWGVVHVAGLVQRQGFGSRSTVAPYTADFDGFYFGSNGSDFEIVARNSATANEERFLQNGTPGVDQWDDPLDGSGPSGETADFNNFTVLEFDFLYLGGTALRCYINIGGKRILFHSVKWSNDNTDTIFKNPAQPVFYEIRSTTGVGNFKQVCAATEVQGSLNLIGIQRSVNNGSAHINANNTSNTYLLKAIRLKSTTRDGFVQVNGFSSLALTNDDFLYSIVLNPTIAGAAPTWSAVSDSVLEEASGDSAGNPSVNTITGGTILASGYSSAQAAVQGAFRSIVRLGTQVDGTRDIITLCAQPLTINLDILGTLETLEI
jgi:hypothetical protein